MMTSEPMSDARLAEIRASWDAITSDQVIDVYRIADMAYMRCYMDDLLADNERLRAREAALVVVVEGLVAFVSRTASQPELEVIQRQARALLAATEPTDATTAE